MTAIEAIIYCIGFVESSVVDGEYHSQVVYDKNGMPHWIAWDAKLLWDASPKFCSESSMPFAASLEPFST